MKNTINLVSENSFKKIRGYALAASLIILLILSLILTAILRSSMGQDVITGNTREKVRALHAAQNAMSYAEWYIQQNYQHSTSCAAGKLTEIKICDSETIIDNSKIPPLSTWSEYVPSADSNFWKTNNEGSAGTFYRNPGFHIQHINTAPDGKADYFRIIAYGYGGNAQAVAVTQSILQITYSDDQITNLGGN